MTTQAQRPGTNAAHARPRAFVAERHALTWSELAESPVWDQGNGLYWIDMTLRQLHNVDLQGHESSTRLDRPVTAIALTPGSHLLAVTESGLGSLNPATGKTTVVANLGLSVGEGMNDACIDPRGRCLAGSKTSSGAPGGALYSFDGRRASVLLRHLRMSNGIDWSPCGGQMYHVDSLAGEVKVWDYEPATGRIGGWRLLIRVPMELGLPDGLTVDRTGGVWLCVWGAGEVWGIDANSGEIHSVIKLPTPCVTSCAFGGEDYSTLFITTADEGHQQGGFVYATRVGVRGSAPKRYAPVLG